MIQKPMRWEEPDAEAIQRAADLEGIDFTSYVRRCALTYTRQTHPQVFKPTKTPAKKD